MGVSNYIKSLREKVGHELLLLPSVSGIVINDKGEVLLHRERETGLWHTIGGAMDPGEEPAEAVVREVREETGLDVVPERIACVTTTPRVRYPNGDEVIYVVITFVCRPVSGEARVNDDESLEVRFFSPDALPELRPDQRERVMAALRNEERAGFRWRGGWR
jgi:8-oxo-dGTP pyrophosphatase MutT (NUDIX family)